MPPLLKLNKTHSIIAECGLRNAGFEFYLFFINFDREQINNEEQEFRARNPKSEIRNWL